jgi:tetratricopeptide (TPR) repeat protein
VLAEAVAIWEAEDAEHPLLHQALGELAAVHGRLGEHRESAQLFSRALALREAVVGPRHSSVSWLVNNLAIAYQELGEHAEAERLYRRALATAEATVGPDHPQVASTLGNLGNCLAAHGAYAEALPHYRRAQAILEARLGAESPASAQNQNNLGETLVGLARHREAEAAFASSLRVFQSTLGERHLYVSWPALNLARLRERAGDLGGAEQLYVLALEIRAAALPPTSPERIEAATAFAGMLRSGGRADEATRVETAVGLVAAVAP